MKTWPVVLVLLVFVVVFAVFLLARDHGVVVIVPIGWKPFDVASILLAAAAVVVTGVGIAVAFLAFVGWQNIKEAAIDASVKASVEEAVTKAQQAAARTVSAYLEMSGGVRDYSDTYPDSEDNNGKEPADPA